MSKRFQPAVWRSKPVGPAPVQESGPRQTFATWQAPGGVRVWAVSREGVLLSWRTLSVLVVLLAAGLVAMGVAVQRFKATASGGAPVRLLTTLEPVPSGTTLTGEMLAERDVPAAYVESRAVRAAERGKILGMRTAIELDPQATLLWSDLGSTEKDRDLSALIQPGQRALTIEAHHNALIRPGDYVDVLATFGERADGNRAGTAAMLLQRVQVLASDRMTQRSAGAGEGDRRARPDLAAVTLSLKVEEVQLVALAAQQGALSVALRSATDPMVVEGIEDLSAADLMGAAARANRGRAARMAGRSPVRVIAGQGAP